MLRKVFFFFLLFFSLFYELDAQNYDSLRLILYSNPPDSQKIKILNRLSYDYADINIDSAAKYSTLALSLLDNVTYYSDKANAFSCFSTVEKLRGNYANSILYSYKALELCNEANDSLCLSSIANNMATTYNLMGDYGAAVDNLMIAIAIDEARSDTLGLGIDYINLGYSYLEIKSYDKALGYAKQSLDYLLLAKDEHGQTYALELLASCYLGKLQPELAKPFIDSSLHLALKTKNDYSYQNNLKQLGDYYFQKKLYDSAHYYYARSIESIHENSYSANHLLSTVAMARCYFAQKDFKNAMTTAEEGYQLSLKGKNKNYTQEISSLLAEIYLAADNITKSNHYLRLSSLYKDSIMNQSIAQSLESRFIQSRLTKEQNEKKVMALSLKQKEEQVYWQGLIILIVGIALLSITMALLFIRKTNLERKRINEELKIKNEQLENLNREINGLVQTIVHDLKSPFNTLQGIFSLLEMEEKSPNSEELLSYGRKAMMNGQEIIQQLLMIREAEEDAFILKNSTFEISELIGELIRDYSSSARSKEITIDAPASSGMITTDRLILRRILDNLLSNAIKFTPKKGNVSIVTLQTNGATVLEIIDDGPGFSQKDREKIFGKFQRLSARPTDGESSNGLGLAIVDILIKKINGQLSLVTDVGKGARFSVKIPN